MNKFRPPVFVTLGPKGTNHELVANHYISFRQIQDAKLILVDEFSAGLTLMSDEVADFMIQAAVHPDCATIVATAHFEFGFHVMDTFISPSKALGILTRSDVAIPQSIGLQPATRCYADLSKWEAVIDVASIIGVADGLLEGRFDSGLTTLELADQLPDQFRVDKVIGTVDDPWIVIGKQRVSEGNLVASESSPITKYF